MVFGWFRRKASRNGAITDHERAAAILAAWEATLAPKPEPALSAEDNAAVKDGRQRFIAFRQTYPPPRDPGLSFYGGAPVGPPGMEWPRGEADGLPLTFIMQWDAKALAAEDPTGLMPRDGVLYLFSNLSKMFRFVHVSGDPWDWTALAEPHDLPPIFANDVGLESPLTSRYIPDELRHVPRLLPCWPFTPVGIDYPRPLRSDDKDEESSWYWTDHPDVKEALLAAQDPFAQPIDRWFPHRPFERPFPAFPQDWAAVRVAASEAVDALAWKSIRLKDFMPEADGPTIAALKETLRQEALDLYKEATAYSPAAAVPPDRADSIWHQLEHFAPVFTLALDGVISESVNLSLGLRSEGAAAIPAALVEMFAWRHSLATFEIRDEYEHEFKNDRGLDLPSREVSALYKQAQMAGELKRVRDIHASAPNRMFGPPSEVQGDAGEYIDDWLLLLELTNSPSVGLTMGEGVLQFMIRPEDLRARRFDKVELIITGY